MLTNCLDCQGTLWKSRSIEADQVNRVQMEQAPITVLQIREATRGDPVLSRVMYYILHGWSVEKCIPDELKIYYNKQDEFTFEDGCILCGTRAVIPTKYQAAVLSELHLNHPGMVRMKSLARLHCEKKDFLKSNGIRHCLSLPYHPASNGEVERAVRIFKESMKTMKDEPGTLADKLARFLPSYRTMPHTATGCTPAELPIGRGIRTRLDILHPDLLAKVSEKTKLENHTTRRNFLPGGPVMVRDYRDRKRPWIKGVIQDRLGPVTYQVMVGNLFWKRHVDQLRSLAGSKVADTESKAEIPLDDAYPEVTPLFHPEQPQIDSQADSTLRLFRQALMVRKIWFQSQHQRCPIYHSRLMTVHNSRTR